MTAYVNLSITKYDCIGNEVFRSVLLFPINNENSRYSKKLIVLRSLKESFFLIPTEDIFFLYSPALKNGIIYTFEIT